MMRRKRGDLTSVSDFVRSKRAGSFATTAAMRSATMPQPDPYALIFRWGAFQLRIVGRSALLAWAIFISALVGGKLLMPWHVLLQ